MVRHKHATRLLVIGAIASVAFATAPAPASPSLYCPPDNPTCVPIIVTCRALQSLHNKVKTVPYCNLA